MPLWHEDSFELKAPEKNQVQENLSALPPTPMGLNAGQKFTKGPILPSPRGKTKVNPQDSSRPF